MILDDIKLSADPRQGLVKTSDGLWARQSSGPSTYAWLTSNRGATNYFMQVNPLTFDAALWDVRVNWPGLDASRIRAPRSGLYALISTIILSSRALGASAGGYSVGLLVWGSDPLTFGSTPTQLVARSMYDDTAVTTTPAFNVFAIVYLNEGDEVGVGISGQTNGGTAGVNVGISAGSYLLMHWLGDYGAAPRRTDDPALNGVVNADGALEARLRLAGDFRETPNGLLVPNARDYSAKAITTVSTGALAASVPATFGKALIDTYGGWNPQNPTELGIPFGGYWLIGANVSPNRSLGNYQLQVSAIPNAWNMAAAQWISSVPGELPMMAVTRPSSSAALRLVGDATGANNGFDAGTSIWATYLGPL